MNMLLRIVVPMLLVLGIATPSYAWIIYHKPAFKGKVIDAETKEPIEGVVVVAVYDKRAIRLAPHSVGIIMHAQETLTAKDGTFVIPSYTTITDPFSFDFEVTFIIYKPGYKVLDKARLIFGKPLSIFAIGPSIVDYMELGKKPVNGHIIEFGSKKTKAYPEGLIFSGEGCKERIDYLKQSTPFTIDYIFLPLEGAREKIKKLEIPLDCPKEGEPVPSVDQTYNFRNDIEEYINKSFAVIELSKHKTREERLLAIPAPPGEYRSQDLPLFFQTINEEQRALGLKGVSK